MAQHGGMGCIHKNMTIEAQVGEYVGEDDIVRIEDDFKRV